MKALSIKQPWAWLIANGHKAIENRDWNTNFRGKFLIHTGQKIDEDAYQFIYHTFPEIHKDVPQPNTIQTGGIIGMVDLIHVVHERDRAHLTERDSPWFFGEYGFVLENAKPLPFMPFKGKLGFFDVDYNLSEAA